MGRAFALAVAVLALAAPALAAAGTPHHRARAPPAPEHPQPRPARPALVLGLALVLQPRRHPGERAAGLSAARLPARADGLERVAGATRNRRQAGVACLAARRGRRLRRRLPDRP